MKGKWCSQTRSGYSSLGDPNARPGTDHRRVHPRKALAMRQQVYTHPDLGAGPRVYGRVGQSGDRWVTLVVFSAKRVPGAARVVNISRKPAQVLPHIKVATLTDRDRLPLGTNFVRPGSYQYDERDFLVYENTRSPAAERRLDAETRERERTAPPMVDRPAYPTPTRVLKRTLVSDLDAPAAYRISPSPDASRDDGPGNPDIQHADDSRPEVLPSAPTAPTPQSSNDCARTTPTAASDSEDPGSTTARNGPLTPETPVSLEGEPVAQSTVFQEPVPALPDPGSMDAQVALALSFVVVAMAGESLDADPAVYYHQGSDFVLLDMLKNQLAYLPDLSDLRPEANIEDAIVGNALPPPARGVVCDLDVGDEKPISMRSRRIPADLLSKVYELLKRLLETGLIEYSNSEWASAIVLVMKKNGTDVRLCIDYRLVNQQIKLMNYPLPLIDELMSNSAATMWFMTLDMTSDFWAVPMTARAS
ncbi:hypothetical protein PHMEG_00029843 [Phytophthora megakarya]|uniref:Reverse transcriptase n=1 Tax=Phytophthora megakarya TaxID=4795 RepID=A0A225V1G3_9STRA|nr:hypothetical protein PHMEG_00029843 [Phytophthora megakarya]